MTPPKKNEEDKDKNPSKTSSNPIKEKAIVDEVQKELSRNAETSNVDKKSIKQLLAAMKIDEVASGMSGIGGINKKDMGEHKFWSTQPVSMPKGDIDGPIDPNTDIAKVRQEPYPIPKEYEWVVLDLSNPQELEDVRELLCLNYVEDDDATLRFNYSSEFLAWALMPPGYEKSWHLGIRVASGKRKLVAFIGAIPMKLRVNENILNTSEVNFLCVHKKLRSKRMAPVLIKEVTRRCNLKGVFQASYTAGVVLPGTVGTCQYYHRPLNIPKLIETGFSQATKGMTMERMIKANEIPKTASLEGWREMEERDVEAVGKLCRAYLSRFNLAPVYSDEEIRHTFITSHGQGNFIDGKPYRNKQVVWSYVVEDPKTKKITDFTSFYSLPSTVVDNEKHPVIDAAYMFYYATDKALPSDWETSNVEKFPRELDIVSRSRLIERLNRLIESTLRVSNEAKFDVFNALTLMDSNQFIDDQKFKPGSGFLNYYLYNWRLSKEITGGISAGRDCSGIGLVML